MTLDEVIKRYSDNAEYERTHGNLQGCLEFRQLAEWLKELKQLREQQPCEDCISRQAAIDELELQAKEMSQWSERYTEQAKGVLTAKNIIKDLPPVTPQPKIGRWIRWLEVIESADGKSTDHIPHCKCSECGTEYDPYSSQFIKYCNKCGTRMWR